MEFDERAEYIEVASHAEAWGNSKYKGPEVRMSLGCQRSSRMCSVAGAELTEVYAVADHRPWLWSG